MLYVHDTTIPHLSFIEWLILKEMILQKKATIISENGSGLSKNRLEKYPKMRIS